MPMGRTKLVWGINGCQAGNNDLTVDVMKFKYFQTPSTDRLPMAAIAKNAFAKRRRPRTDAMASAMM